MNSKAFCVHGHDVSVVGRCRSNGRCAECQRAHARDYKKRNHAKILHEARLDRELARRVRDDEIRRDQVSGRNYQDTEAAPAA